MNPINIPTVPQPAYDLPVISSPQTAADGNGISPLRQQASLSAIFDNAVKANASKLPVWSNTAYTPYDEAKRYMAGLGHTGYTGPETSEDFNAVNQSWGSKAVNGLLKGLTITGTSFVDGTAGLVTGGLEALATGDFSRIFNNGVSNLMEDIREGSENVLPNYYTDKESKAPLWSPDYWARINFLSDKLIKNLGWAAAAMGESALISKVGRSLAGRLILGRAEELVKDLESSVSAIQNGTIPANEAKGFLSRKLAGYLSAPVADLGELGSIQHRYGTLAGNIEKGIERFGNIIATGSEANAEALQGYRDIRKDLISQYQEQHSGMLPDEKAMGDIEARAKQVGTLRFWANAGILSVTNNIEFPRLMNGALKFERKSLGRQVEDLAVEGSERLVAGTGETYIQQPHSRLTQTLKSIAKTTGVVANSEALEEGLQYAVESGLHDYEMRSRDPKAIEALGNIFSEGLPKVLSTREGWENMLIGGLSGKAMSVVLERGDNRKQQTAEFLQKINAGPQAGSFISGASGSEFTNELSRSVVRGISLLTDKKQATEAGDIVKAKDLEADYIFNYVLPRVKYGRYDLVEAELNQYRSRPLEEVRTELGLPEGTTSAEINSRIDSLLSKAASIQGLHNKMQLAYGLPWKGQAATYNPQELEGMAYLAYKSWDAERRGQQLATDLQEAFSTVPKAGVLPVEALYDKSLRAKQDSTGSYDLEEIRNQLFKQINDVDPLLRTDKNGIGLEQKLQDLERLQNARESYLRDYEDVKNKTYELDNTFDPERTDTAGYLAYEQRQARNLVQQQLIKNTELRPFANEIDRQVTAGKLAGRDLAAILSDIKARQAFIWDKSRNRIADIIANELGRYNQLQDEHAGLMQQNDRLDQLVQQMFDARDGFAEPLTEEQEQEQYHLEDTEKSRKARIDELEKQIAGERVNTDALVKMRDALGADLQHVPGDPRELTLMQRRRKIADALLSEAEEIENNVKGVASMDSDGNITGIGDYGDEHTLQRIDLLQSRIKALQQIFSRRKDISFKKGEFRGYLDELLAKQAFLEQVHNAISRRLSDRETVQKQSEQTYVSGLGLAFGFDLVSGKVINQSLYDLVRNGIGQEQFDNLLEKIQQEKRVELVHEMMDLLSAGLNKSSGKELLTAIANERQQVMDGQLQIVREISANPLFRSTPVEHNYQQNPYLFFPRLMLYVSAAAEEHSSTAMRNYRWHRNAMQFWTDTATEISSGRAKDIEGYEDILPADQRLKLAKGQATLLALNDLEQSLRGTASFSEIYHSLRLQVADANRDGKPVPTAQQLISIIQAVKGYFSQSGDGLYSNWTYLEGVIGAGKTSIFTKYVLGAIGNISEKDLPGIIYATANTREASATINDALGIDAEPAISDLITELQQGNFDRELIILDEAARPSAQVIGELAAAIRDYNQRKDAAVKVIAIGDSNQILDTTTPGIESADRLQALMPFSVSYRSNVSSIADVQAIYKSAGSKRIDGIRTSGSVSRLTDGGGDLVYGVFGSRSEEEMLEGLKSRPVNAPDGGKLTMALIVNKGKEAFWRSKLKNEGVAADVQVIDYYNAQGKTFDEVYLWLETDPSDHLMKNEHDLNSAIYTNIRGRNLVYIGNTDVETVQKDAVRQQVDTNMQQNADRGKLLFDKLDNAVREFALLLPEAPQVPSSATDSAIRPDDRIGQQLLDKSAMELLHVLSETSDEQQEHSEFASESEYNEADEQVLNNIPVAEKIDDTGAALPESKHDPVSGALSLSHPTSENLRPSVLDYDNPDVMVLAVPNGADSFRLSVVQQVKGNKQVFNELSVIGERNGEAETLGLSAKLAELNRQLQEDPEFKKLATGVSANGKSQIQVTDTDKLHHFIVASGKIDFTGTAPLRYSYNHDESIKDTVFGKASKLADYVSDRVKSVFTGHLVVKNNNPVIIGTQANRLKYGGANSGLLVPASPHFIFKIGQDKYQAVELKGRVLSYDEPIHYTIYGDPTKVFFEQLSKFTSLAGLDQFFAGNNTLLTDAGLSLKDFEPGTVYWNKLVVLLSDGRYKQELASRKLFTEAQAKLFDAIIEHIKSSGNLEQVRAAARILDDLAYSKQYQNRYAVSKDGQPVLKDDKELSFSNKTEALKYTEGHEGTEFAEHPDTYIDDFGTVQLRHKGRTRAGQMQLALEHLMKANPVIKRAGQKTLFPVFTRSYKQGDKTISELRVRNMLHHKLDGQAIATGHERLLETYILKQLGILKAFGLNDQVRIRANDATAIRRKLSEVYYRVGDLVRTGKEINNLNFSEITEGLADKFSVTGESLLLRLCRLATDGYNEETVKKYVDIFSYADSEQRKVHSERWQLEEKVKKMVAAVFDGDENNIQRFYNYWSQVAAEKEQYQTQLSFENIRDLLHPDAAMNVNGLHKLGLRLNIPLMWQFTRKQHFRQLRYDAATGTTKEELVDKSGEDQVHEMLTTRFTGLSPATLSVSLNKGQAMEQVKDESKTPEQDQAVPTPSKRAVRPSRGFQNPGNDHNFATLLRNDDAIANRQRTVYSREVLQYIRRFLPKIKAAELQVLDALQMFKVFNRDLYGAFMDGVIYLERNADDTVYAEAIRHEVFHSVFRQFLTTEQRKQVLDAAREQYHMHSATTEDVEEKLAREFQARPDKKGMFTVIKNFFRRLAEIFRFINRNHYKIEDLFDRIERGKFRQMSRDKLFTIRPAALSKVEDAFGKNPWYFKRAKDYVHRFYADYGFLGRNNEMPHMDWEIKDLIIDDLITVKQLLEFRLNEARQISVAEREQVNQQWDKLSSREQHAIIAQWEFSGEDHELYNRVFTQDDEVMLAAVNGLLKTKPSSVGKEYYVINEFIKSLKPDINSDDLLSNEEIDFADADAVANLQSLLEKDDSVDIRSKMTGDLKLFLSTIFRIGRNNVPQFVRLEQALYYVYENISLLNGSSTQDFKQNLRVAFESTGINSWQKQLVYEAIQRIADMANTDSVLSGLQYEHPKYGSLPVSLNEHTMFTSENSFQYNGINIDRNNTTGRESTDDFFNTILQQVTGTSDNGAHLFGGGYTLQASEFTHDDLKQVLKSYWQRDMANKVLQDMINLADSLYFTNPYIGEYNRMGGATTYTTYSLQPDKDKPLVKSNFLDAVHNLISSSDNRKRISTLVDNLHQLRFDNTPGNDVVKEKEKRESLLSEVFNALGLVKGNVATASVNQAREVSTAVWQFLSGLDSMDNDEAFKRWVNNSKGYISKITELLSYNQQAEKTIASYIRSDGKKQFFQRYMAFANKTLLKLVRNRENGKKEKGGRWKINWDPYLQLPFFQHNILNPGGIYKTNINQVLDYTLDDGVAEKDNPDSAVLYDGQSPVDYLTRVFLVQFGGAINNNLGSDAALTYKQNFYTVSDKSTNTNAELYILGNNPNIDLERPGIGTAIWAAIRQELDRPDPSLLNLKNYTEKDRTVSLLPGLQDAGQLREQLRQAIENGEDQAHLHPAAQKLVNKVYQALTEQAAASLDEIMRINANAMYGADRISRDKAILFDTQLESQYNKLLSKQLVHNDQFNNDHFELSDKNNVPHLVLKEYSPNLYNWHVAKEHIAPLWELFYLNNYINGLFLNQIVAGDQAMFKHSVDQVKRMAGPFATGMSPLQVNGYYDADYHKAVSVNTRRMNGKYRVAVSSDLYLVRKGNGHTEYIFRAEKEAKKLLESGDTLINATDAAGIMSDRRHRQTLKGYGPGLDLKANQKPVHWEIDPNGVPRYLKYASFALTDEVCRAFPKYLDMRVVMETHGMNEADKAETERLIRKQVAEGLEQQEHLALERLFATNEGRYIDELIHESGVKTGLPATLSGYNAASEIFDINDGSVLELDNSNWRIQLNPSAKVDSHVSLFTQLLYYAGFDKNNLQSSSKIYDALADWFRLGLNKILKQVGVKDVAALKETPRDQIVSAVKSMVMSRIAGSAGKERLLEYLKEGISLDAPFIANDVTTQLSAIFNKGIIQVKFPGSKFQLLSPEMTDYFRDRKNTMPKYDPEQNIMEVYLPNIWKKYLPADVGEINDEQVKELNLVLGFRIPSTGLNSSARIKVIGFWPTKQNVVVAPADINFQMGSDYDVDSLFIARPEILTPSEQSYLEQKGIVAHRVAGFVDGKQIEGLSERLDSNSSDAAGILQKVYSNRIVYGYLDMLADKTNYADIQRPTDFELLKSVDDPNAIFNYVARSLDHRFAENFEKYQQEGSLEKEREKILASKKDINDIWNNMQMYLANRSGKSLVGVTANTTKTFAYLVHQSFLQGAPVLFRNGFTYNGHEFDRIGYRTDEASESVYNQDGKKLSEVFSLLINAAVDNAKEQILSVINMTTSNSNAFMTLVGAGMSLKSVVTIMRQPVIMELSELSRINGYSIKDKREYIAGKLGIGADRQQLDEFLKDTVLSDGDIAGYLQFERMNSAEISQSGEQLNTFYRHQLAVLDLFERAQEIGGAFFSLSRSLSVLQNNQPSLEDQQNIMDEIFRLYRMKKELTTGSNDVSFEYKTYELDTDHKSGILREDFPLQGVDLLKIPHWKAAFDQMQALYHLNTKALFRHSGTMQRLSQNLEKAYDLKLDSQPNRNRAMIRSEIIKAVLSGVRFSYQGRTIDFSTFRQAPHELYNRKGELVKTLYRNEAFIQNFVDKVRQYKKAWPDNPFLRLLRIENDWQSGLSKIIVKDVTGITTEFEELKIVENGFKEIDSEQRKAYEGKYGDYWYSDFQFDFVKYLAITQGLRFGSTTYAWLLPADIYAMAIRSLDNSFKLMQQGIENGEVTAYQNLSKRISDFVALQIAKNKADDLGRLHFGKYEYSFSLKPKSDREGNFYNMQVSGKSSLPEQEGDNKISLYEQLPALIRHKLSDKIDGVSHVSNWVLVKTGQDSKGNVLYQLLGQASYSEHYEFDNGILHEDNTAPYQIRDRFSQKQVYVQQVSIVDTVKGNFLRYAEQLEPGQLVTVLKKGDALRLNADRYIIQSRSGEGSAAAVKEINKKIAVLISARQQIQVNKQSLDSIRQRLNQAEEKLRNEPTDAAANQFAALMQQFESSSEKLAEKNELEQQIDTLKAERDQQMFQYEIQQVERGFVAAPPVVKMSEFLPSPNDIESGMDQEIGCGG